MNRLRNTIHKSRLTRLGFLLPIIFLGIFYFSRAYGAQLPQRSLLISDSRANRTGVTYVLSFNLPSSETLGSIKLQICANDPLLNDPCTTPSGFDISSATLSSQSGATGFTILPAGTNPNTIVLSRLPATSGPGSVSYTFTGVVNPSTEDTYYGRLQTFSSIDASGSENDHGGLAFSISDAIQVTTTVPPYLLFCTGITITGFDCATASGNYINFGNLNSSSTSSGQTQMLTATNAASGFNIRVSGPTMTSGNNIINALATRDVSRPGSSQFGLNLVANQTPSVGLAPQGPGAAAPVAGYDQANFYKFVSGDVVASAPGADAYKLFTVSYIVNVPKDQSPGVYVTSLTYVCLANF